MRKYEAVAKSADEAIEEILQEMGVSIDDLDIEIDEANKGIFSFLKQRQVKVTATLKDGVKEPREQLASKAESASNSKENQGACEMPEKTVSKDLAASSKIETKQAVQENTLNVSEETEDCTTAVDDEMCDDFYENEALINEPKTVIRDFIENIATGIQRDVEVNVKENVNSLNIDIKGDDLSILIGRHGRTLDSMRYLLSLMVNRGRKKEDIKRIRLDVEGYRKKRDISLERLARNVASKVISSGKESKLDPMNPYERRIVHSSLQRNKLVTTRSEGEEPNRCVIVYLK